MFDFSLGTDPNGLMLNSNLLKVSHLLVSGTTGSGKSVFIDSMLLNLILQNPPEKLKIILCDSKAIEFGQYNGIAHLLIPVCTDTSKIFRALFWTYDEGKRRLDLFSENRIKDFCTYNDGLWERFAEEIPRILIVVDDLSSVLTEYPEALVPMQGIFSIGRVTGIHLIAVTQTPMAKCSKKICSQFFSKMIFPTASSAEIRFLTGRKTSQPSAPGDAIFCSGSILSNVHTKMFPDALIKRVIELQRENYKCSYDEKILSSVEQPVGKVISESSRLPINAEANKDVYDELLPVAIDVVLEVGHASVSMIQRRLKLGYGRAAKIVDQMFEMGIVGPYEGATPRKIFITKEQWEKMKRK